MSAYEAAIKNRGRDVVKKLKLNTLSIWMKIEILWCDLIFLGKMCFIFYMSVVFKISF